MNKKYMSFGLALIMALSISTPALAATVGDAATGKEVPVTLNSEAVQFSVTVPTALPISVNASGDISVATNTKIINNSSGPVQVNKVEAQGINGWTLVDYSSDFIAEKLGTKKLGLQINGDTTNQAGALNFTQDNWSTIKGLQELGLTYNAVLAPQKESINESIANIIFTLGWDSAPAEPKLTRIVFRLGSAAHLTLGDTIELKVYGEYDNKTTGIVDGSKLDWSSSNKFIVDVTESGTVKALNYGQATITATYGELKTTCEFTVPSDY